MATDFDRLFGLRSLNGRVEAFGEDVTRGRLWTDKYMNQGRKLIAEDGNTEWDEVRFSRGLAPVVGSMGRFPRKPELSKVLRTSAVADIKLSVELNPRKLYQERLPGTLRPGAREYVELEMRDLVIEIGNTLEYMAAETSRGTLTVNAANIPGTTQPFTIAYTPNTFTALATWAAAGTGILSSEIPAFKIDFEQTSGKSPAQVIAGSTVEGFIVGNTEVSNFARLALGERFVTQSGILNGPMLGGLQVGGLSWTITEKGYVPTGGAFTRFLPTTDEAIVLPADNELMDVLGMAQGRGMVPRQMLGPAAAAADLIRPADTEGFYSYAMLGPDGQTVVLFVGFVGLPVLMRPQALQVLNLIP